MEYARFQELRAAAADSVPDLERGSGDWEKSRYEEFGKQCRDFGIIMQGREKRRKPSVIVLRVSPGDSWLWYLLNFRSLPWPLARLMWYESSQETLYTFMYVVYLL